MSDHPTETEFRQAGFTAAAINYPLSDAAVAWLLKFNGAPDGWVPPRAWRYAPNPTMRETLERNAAALPGATLSDVPLLTGTGQGKAPEISGGVGTAQQQTKILQGMRDAVACARGECDCPETTYTVRNRPGRVSITNQTTGQTTIYPANN